MPCLKRIERFLLTVLKSASLLAKGGTNSAQSLSTKSLLDEGEPSIRLRFPVKNIIEGSDSLKSVKEIVFSLSLRETRDEISAVTEKLSSPETLAET